MRKHCAMSRRRMGRIRLTIPLSLIPSRCEGRRWHQMRLHNSHATFTRELRRVQTVRQYFNSAAEFIN